MNAFNGSNDWIDIYKSLSSQSVVFLSLKCESPILGEETLGELIGPCPNAKLLKPLV